MDSKKVAGWTLIALAVASWLTGIGDTIGDLRDWHGLGQPAVVGVLLKQLGTVIVAAIGGTLLPQPGQKEV